MSTNNVIVSETNYNVTVDESNNLTVEIALPSVGQPGPVGYTGSAGADGYVGADGAQGYTGSAGIQGVQGNDGSNGFTGSVGFTGSAGTNGAVGATGAVGFTGSAGQTGATGVQGFTGSAGVNGTNGVDGAQGYTGSKGADGIIGYNGSIGYTGSAGIQGYTGSAGADGIIGYNGSIGYTGSASTIPGPQGPIGFTGSAGSGGGGGSSVTVSETPPATPLNGDMWWNSADGQLKVRYEDTDSAQWVDAINGIVGDTGYVGSQGIQGYTGSQGDIGYTGSQGDIGYVGSQGVQGYTGSQGIQGVQGLQGYTGSQGDIGYTGSASTVIGYTGSKGQDGAVVLDDLNDVTIATPTAAQILGYNGSQWINTAAPQGAPGYLYSGTITTQPTGTGEDTLVIGDGASADTSGSSVAIGKSANLRGDNGIAIGTNAVTGPFNSVSQGITGQVAIGWGAVANRTSAIAFGKSANTQGVGGISIGNTATTAYVSGAIAIGSNTNGSANYAIALGETAQATGSSSIAIGGGNYTTAAGQWAIAMGYGAKANGNGSIALGGANNSSYNFVYNVVYGRNSSLPAGFHGESTKLTSGSFATKTNSPSRLDFNMWYKTTSETQAELGTGAENDTPTNYIYQPDSSVMTYEIQLVAYRTDVAGEYASWKIEAMSHKQTTAASTVVTTPVITQIGANGGNTWSVTMVADTTNGRPAIKVTGEAGKTIYWGATVKATRISN